MTAYFGIFAKYWQPGRVKTRLAEHVGPQTASEVYLFLLRTLLMRCQACGQQRVVAISPPQHLREFESLVGGHYQLTTQAAGDLGTRIHSFFEQAFQSGATRVVLIGSDSPDLPTKFIDQAFAALNDARVVLGPAEDGGYYLVGMRPPAVEMFSEITWSTNQVWEQTLQRLTELGIEPAILPPWYDVDEIADLARLRDSLRSNAAPLPIEAELLQKLDEVLNP